MRCTLLGVCLLEVFEEVWQLSSNSLRLAEQRLQRKLRLRLQALSELQQSVQSLVQLLFRAQRVCLGFSITLVGRCPEPAQGLFEVLLHS